MRIGLLLASLLASTSLALDVSKLTVGAPASVAQIETSRGEPRRLAWAPDGATLYLQLVSGKPPAEQAHHLVVHLADGRVEALESEPAWAHAYWTRKQDRHAPGDEALILDIDMRQETLKAGPGPSGVLDRTGSPNSLASAGPSAENLAAGSHGNQKVSVVALSFVGQEIARWINTPKPMPGLVFGWGPEGSDALVYASEKGVVTLLDRKKRRLAIPGTSDALLPAWSDDGERLAWLMKRGKNTHAVVWAPVSVGR